MQNIKCKINLTLELYSFRFAMVIIGFSLLMVLHFLTTPQVFASFYDGKIREYESAISKEASELKVLEAEIGIQRNRVHKIEKKESAVHQELANIEKNLDARARELEIYQWNLGHAKKRRAQLLDDLEETSSVREEKCQALSGILKDIYKAGILSDLIVVPTPADIEEHKLLTLAACQNARVFNRAQQRANQIKAGLKELDQYQGKVLLYRGAASKKKAKIARDWRSKRELLAKTCNQRQVHQQKLSQLQSEARAIRALIETLQAKKRETEETARLASIAFQKKKGLLSWPTQSRRVARYFGKERHPQFETYTFNSGIDIEIPKVSQSSERPSDVICVSNGKVVFAQWSSNPGIRSYGKLVIIDHGGGYYTLYSHLSTIFVKLGEEISAGQIVGRVGDITSSDEPFFHFEIRRGGQPLDPLEWLEK
jgi:murein DD-endopeptidase MepM/ murein hydrolase activator NlpD